MNCRVVACRLLTSAQHPHLTDSLPPDSFRRFSLDGWSAPRAGASPPSGGGGPGTGGGGGAPPLPVGSARLERQAATRRPARPHPTARTSRPWGLMGSLAQSGSGGNDPLVPCWCTLGVGAGITLRAMSLSRRYGRL